MMTTLASMISALHLAGMLSVLCWAAALLLVLLPSRYRWRTVRYWQALVLLLVALHLADLRFVQVARYRTDQSVELAAAEQRRLQEAAKAGDTSEGENPDAVYEAAAARGAQAADARAYRQRGRVEREAGRRVEEAPLVEIERAAEQVVAKEAKAYRSSELLRMRRWARGNRRFTVACLWLMGCLTVLDYMRRLHTPADAYLPLPLDGPWLNLLFPDVSSVWLTAGAAGDEARYLETLVRKGESFIRFGTGDPWEGRAALPRIVVPNPRPLLALPWRHLAPVLRSRRPAWADWVDRRLAGGPLLAIRPLTLVRYQGALPAGGMDDTLESAWFRRYGFSIHPGAHAGAWLEALDDFLRRRQIVLASARRTVNLVFASGDLLSREQFLEFQFLCSETNCRLTVITPPGAQLPPDCQAEVRIDGA